MALPPTEHAVANSSIPDFAALIRKNLLHLDNPNQKTIPQLSSLSRIEKEFRDNSKSALSGLNEKEQEEYLSLYSSLKTVQEKPYVLTSGKKTYRTYTDQ